MEDDLKKKIVSQFQLNLEANISWDWLSSLRFSNIRMVGREEEKYDKMSIISAYVDGGPRYWIYAC
jgi:hypothetical protein